MLVLGGSQRRMQLLLTLFHKLPTYQHMETEPGDVEIENSMKKPAFASRQFSFLNQSLLGVKP
jgi:hypothetical protein